MLLAVGLTALAMAFPSAAQLSAQSYNVRMYTNLDGLPQSQVLALLQGRDGYIWFATYGGAGRYSGSSVRSFTTSEGLSSNLIDALAEDSEGRMYFGTRGGGMCVLGTEDIHCFDESDGLPSPYVQRLIAGEDGAIWAATDQGLVHFLDGVFTTYSTGNGLPAATVLALAFDDSGVLWAGTSAGLARFDGESFEEAQPGTLTGAGVEILLPTPDGLLVGTSATLWLFDGDEMRRLAPEGLPAGVTYRDASLSGSGALWIATSAGMLRLDDEGSLLLTEANGLPDDELLRVMVDREENVWIATNSGAAKLMPGPFRGYSVREGLPNSFARALAQDREGRLWVGTRDGAARSSASGSSFETMIPGSALTDARIFSAAGTPDGGMLLGTPSGLVHWADGNHRLLTTDDGLPGNNVVSMIPDDSGGLWVGTDEGLAVWNDGSLQPLPPGHPLLGHFAASLALDRAGHLWIGLLSGGVRVWDGVDLRVLDEAGGLSDQVIWDMAADSAGRMWIGTNGDGAFRVDGPDILRLTTADGLRNDFVWQVLVDSRAAVWLYTNLGLDRIEGGDPGEIRHFGPADGLIDQEGTAGAVIEDVSGRIWFGTARGVMSYHPGSDAPNLIPPPVQIEAVTLGGVLVDHRSELRFDPDLLQIRFEALTFRDEHGVRYRYRLLRGDRRDDPWSDAGTDQTVSFASLRPGAYTFEVMATNSGGIRSERPASLSFTIVPALWQTWWFQVLAFLSLAGSAAAIPIVRTRRLRTNQKVLQSIVTERTTELEAANTRLRDEIKDRRRFEVALRENEARLRDIVENSTNVFYSHTLDNEITYISPQVEEVLGVPVEEVPERWTEFATDHRLNEEGERLTRKAIETGVRQPPYELELRRGDGKLVRVQVTEAPVTRNGEVVGLVGSLTDLTESRRIEAEKHRLEEQLNQARKMEAVGRLAAGIAHDFNNLLTSIMGHTDLMALELRDDHPLRSDLEEVELACRRAAGLVAQLLAFGRKQMAQPTPLDLNRFVEDSVKMLRRLVGTDVEMVMELSPDTPWILMDGSQMDQLLLNLVLNARDAMPGGGTLTITTTRRTLNRAPADWGELEFAPGDRAVLLVGDTGEGMEPETATRIFEPFFTTKEIGEGSGLGLATVYGIVKQNGGHIDVDTGPGRGTTFRVYLPVVPDAARGTPGNVAGSLF